MVGQQCPENRVQERHFRSHSAESLLDGILMGMQTRGGDLGSRAIASRNAPVIPRPILCLPWLGTLFGVLGVVLCPCSTGAMTSAEKVDFFERRIRPVLVERCEECHGRQSQVLKGGLRVDSRSGLLRGGDTGPSLVPGDPERSLLLKALSHADPDLKMPPKGRLSDSVLADFRRWILEGAMDPREEAQEIRREAVSAGSNHWAFQPLREVPPPGATNRGETSHPVDRFIDAKLQPLGLHRAPPADARTLVRRAYYDLIGLPPSQEETDRFVADTAPDAFARLVERLLASPRYGERWARWWLDVARYADTNGQDENKVMANAWRYRDWVIRSFNENLPFDRFTTFQLAGDLLPTAGVAEPEVFDRWTATGFLVLGPKMLAEQDKPKLVMDLVDEQIDVVSRAFLGLTAGCARCHDHKYDPIPSRDYYALAGIFRSTRTMENLNFVSKFNERRIASAPVLAALESHTKTLTLASNAVVQWIQSENVALTNSWRNNLDTFLRLATGSDSPEIPETNQVARLRAWMLDPSETNVIGRELRELAAKPDSISAFLGNTNITPTHVALFGSGGVFELPKNPRPFYPAHVRERIVALERERDEVKSHAPTPAAHTLAVEDDKAVDLPVYIRGSHLNPGKDPIPRGFIQVAHPGVMPTIGADRSGRLELAEWLTGPENPLTARVIVNRVWQAHFGEGLVRTPDNFGLRGELPTHPELLDWLAGEFVRSDWDIKRLHRLILGSATWQQAGNRTSGAFGREVPPNDPENRLLWHFPRQRLEAEMVRDALLAVSGRLDLRTGGSLVDWKNDEYAPPDEVSAESERRSVYLPVVRDRVYEVFTLFDFANPSVGVSKRVPTVVSHQALFFLNSPLVKHASRSLARRLVEVLPGDPGSRIRWAYESAVGRLPSEAEVRRAMAFVNSAKREDSPAATMEAWAAWCQTLFASNEFLYRE